MGVFMVLELTIKQFFPKPDFLYAKYMVIKLHNYFLEAGRGCTDMACSVKPCLVYRGIIHHTVPSVIKCIQQFQFDPRFIKRGQDITWAFEISSFICCSPGFSTRQVWQR